MPGGSQNIENWTVDQFKSVIFPTTTPVDDYRGYLYGRNLKKIPAERVAPVLLPLLMMRDCTIAPDKPKNGYKKEISQINYAKLLGRAN